MSCVSKNVCCLELSLKCTPMWSTNQWNYVSKIIKNDSNSSTNGYVSMTLQTIQQWL